jgi:hypothetical protein
LFPPAGDDVAAAAATVAMGAAAVGVVVEVGEPGAAGAAGFFLGRPAFLRSTSTHWSALPSSTHFLHGRLLPSKKINQKILLNKTIY